MNVAFIISTKNWGGVKTWMLEFGKGLEKLGHRTFFFASDDRLIAEAVKLGCVAEKIKFGFDYSPITISKFLILFKKYDIDICVMNIYKELKSAGVAACFLGLPVIHRVGLAGDIDLNHSKRLIHKYLVDEIIVPCFTMKEQLLKDINFIKDDEIKVIYNGKMPKRAIPHEKGSPVRFVISSKLEKSKGHDILLEAFGRLKNESLDDFELTIFGTGGEYGALQNLAEKLNIADKVIFKGFQRDVAEKLSHFDFGVLVSHTEGFPNTALEYTAAGLPVVATDVSGTKEIIKNGFNGILIPPSDVNSTKTALKRCMLMSQEEYEQFCNNARITAEEFNIEIKIKEFEEYLKEHIK